MQAGGDPLVEVGGTIPPQRERARTDEGLGVAVRGRCPGFAGLDFRGLAQVGRGVDTADAGLHLDQGRDRGCHRARSHGAAAIGKQFGVQGIAPAGLAMAVAGVRGGQRVVEDAVGNQEPAVIERPQQVVRQFMAKDCQQFLLRQALQQGALQNDVDFARHVDQRGIHFLPRGLVQRCGPIDAQSCHRLCQRCVHIRMRVGIEAIGVAQQRGAKRLQMLGVGGAGPGPIPDFGFVVAQIIHHCGVIGQRHQHGAVRGVGVHMG